MPWMESYRNKTKQPDEAVTIVKSGQRVYCSGNAAAPMVLLQALAKRGKELDNVELLHVLLIGEDPFGDPKIQEHFFHSSFFVGSADRKAVNTGHSAYIPIHLHEIPRLLEARKPSLDVAMIQTSPPDEHGFLSLGVEVLTTKAAIKNAGHVIAQVNRRMPRTLGDSFVHVSQVDTFVEVDESLICLEQKPISETDQLIGGHIANLIEDGDTLQLGIGGIPNAVLGLLEGKRDIGIHTEMVSDALLEAIDKGIITGNRKSLHPGKIITTFVMGSKKLYDFVDDNPFFEFHPADYTNNPITIAKNDRMIAINSALEVDITGQVCADSIGTYIYSGFGGQVDFIRGAAASKGGKPIIALPATAKKGQLSRIVSTLKEGSGIVTSRADVHYIATEYGVADLYGKNLQERTSALIQIAHPDFRESLEKSAWERKLLPRGYAVKWENE